MKRWSQLKKTVEAFFAEAVRGRVELRAAAYSPNPDSLGRAYITIDGVEVWKFCSYEVMKRKWEIDHASLERTGVRRMTDDELNEYNSQIGAMDQSRNAEGVLSKLEFYGQIIAYISLPYAEASRSNSFVFLVLAILDRRLGKRRIPKLFEQYQQHPLLRKLYEFRCEAEGLPVTSVPRPAER